MGAAQSDNSGERAGLEMFFDYIVELDGLRMISPAGKASDLKDSMTEPKDSRTTKDLNIYVWIIPSKWGGNGLLGATVRYDQFESASGQGLRIVEVFPNSPAAQAGLVPFTDFLLGTADNVFKDLDELIEVVNAHINRDLRVFVYNTKSEVTREVVIVPNYDWGGQGCLGCDIGTGYLHRVPSISSSRHGGTTQPDTTKFSSHSSTTTALLPQQPQDASSLAHSSLSPFPTTNVNPSLGLPHHPHEPLTSPPFSHPAGVPYTQWPEVSQQNASSGRMVPPNPMYPYAYSNQLPYGQPVGPGGAAPYMYQNGYTYPNYPGVQPSTSPPLSSFSPGGTATLQQQQQPMLSSHSHMSKGNLAAFGNYAAADGSSISHTYHHHPYSNYPAFDTSTVHSTNVSVPSPFIPSSDVSSSLLSTSSIPPTTSSSPSPSSSSSSCLSPSFDSSTPPFVTHHYHQHQQQQHPWTGGLISPHESFSGVTSSSSTTTSITTTTSSSAVIASNSGVGGMGMMGSSSSSSIPSSCDTNLNAAATPSSSSYLSSVPQPTSQGSPTGEGSSSSSSSSSIGLTEASGLSAPLNGGTGGGGGGGAPPHFSTKASIGSTSDSAITSNSTSFGGAGSGGSGGVVGGVGGTAATMTGEEESMNLLANNANGNGGGGGGGRGGGGGGGGGFTNDVYPNYAMMTGASPASVPMNFTQPSAYHLHPSSCPSVPLNWPSSTHSPSPFHHPFHIDANSFIAQNKSATHSGNAYDEHYGAAAFSQSMALPQQGGPPRPGIIYPTALNM